MKKITLKIYTVLLILLNVTIVEGQCWKQVSGGNNFTLAIKNDGTLWAWGRVQGDYGTQESPIQIGTDNDWKIAEAAGEYSLVIKNNGTLWGWGKNGHGGLGNGTNTDVMTITQIGSDSDWKSISAYITTLAQKNDGTLWVWGSNQWGQAGVSSSGNIVTPTRIGDITDQWKSFSTYNDCSAGVKTDGTLWIWGQGITRPAKTTDLNTWEKVACGSGHRLALKTDGTLWSWGVNYYGQLGLGNTDEIQTVTQIGIDTDWKDISTGYFTSYAQKTNKTVWKWGLQEGINQKTPIQVGIDNDWKSFDAGDDHIMLLKNDDNMWGFGSDYLGQLGNGISLYSQNSPAAIACAGSLGTNNFVDNNFAVFPNPTKGMISISNEDNLSIDKIDILDVLGKTISVKTDSTNQIDISEFSKGIYILKLYSGKTIFQKKIMKQ